MEARELVEDVNLFLADLRAEFPEVFTPPRPPPGAAPTHQSLRETLTERIAHWAPRLGVAPKRVFIKNQRTRWGSCSEQGNLNFNWRLARAPAEVVEYVVIHELAHLLEMNHSKRFWEHVDRWCPEHRVHRRWLRENSRELGRRNRGG